MPKTALEMVIEARAQLENITPAVAEAEVEAGEAVLLDVREPVEWEEHIAGRRPGAPRGAGVRGGSHQPAPQAGARSGAACDRLLPVRCAVGARGVTLRSSGTSHVANLEGGFTAWKDAGLPVAYDHDGL